MNSSINNAECKQTGYIHITDEDIKNSVQSRKAIFDKNGEYQSTINNQDEYTIRVKIKFAEEIDERG